MRWLMGWFFGKSDQQQQVEERLRRAERQEQEALERNQRTAIGNTIKADDTAEALAALLDRMEQRSRRHGPLV
jgi:hypothetical protein